MSELRVPSEIRTTDEPGTIYCVFCDRPVDPYSRRTYRGVRGFEVARSQGGTNAIALRRSLDEFAHPECVDRERRGITARQGSLL